MNSINLPFFYDGYITSCFAMDMTSDHLIVAMQQQWGSATMQQEPPVIPEGNAVQSYYAIYLKWKYE